MEEPGVAGRARLRDIARRAMVERGLEPAFSGAAIAEANGIARAPSETDASIRDLRRLPWASIDNDDSRDLDQLSVADGAGAGTTRILVAIADVDACVRVGSAVDGHARTNTTSVYTAAEIFPMLPERLSTDLTSLGEGQERLAIVIEMAIGEDGAVMDSGVYRAVVVNRAKLAYSGVAAWLDGTAPAPRALSAVPGMDDQLRIQDGIARRMRGLRARHGALDLETVEARPVFDGDALTGLRPDEKNRAKALIEDFMIAANGVTARVLQQKGFPSFRRVLRAPERWARI
ncbi:MAG: ribonuclease catalytic domain-containing protein, partial [Myxococcales bacterium]